jgi:single-stranded DNA-binding protein
MNVAPEHPQGNSKSAPSDENFATLTGTIEKLLPIPRRDPSKVGFRFLLLVVHRKADGSQAEQRFNVAAWDDAAAALQSFAEGSHVRVRGRLHRESWADKTTGLRRYDTSVIASEVEAAQ